MKTFSENFKRRIFVAFGLYWFVCLIADMIFFQPLASSNTLLFLLMSGLISFESVIWEEKQPTVDKLTPRGIVIFLFLVSSFVLLIYSLGFLNEPSETHHRLIGAGFFITGLYVFARRIRLSFHRP